MPKSLKERIVDGADFFIKHQKELDSQHNKELVIKFCKMILEYFRQETFLKWYIDFLTRRLLNKGIPA